MTSLHAAAVAFCNAVLQLASAFGAHLTGDQNVAVALTMNTGLVLLSVVVGSRSTTTKGKT